MTNLIINLLAALVGALVIAIMIIVTIYKDRLQKVQKRCEKLQRQNKILRHNNNEMYECCAELLQKCQKHKIKMQIASSKSNCRHN